MPAPTARPAFLRPRLVGLVVAGGTVGTLVRYLLESALPAQPGSWPWTTFVINVSGSFVIAVLVASIARRERRAGSGAGADSGSAARRRPDPEVLRRVWLVTGTGVLGGYTTYSTFIVEVDTLLRDGHVRTGLGYAVASVVLGVVAAALGLLAPRVRDRRARGVSGDAP